MNNMSNPLFLSLITKNREAESLFFLPVCVLLCILRFSDLANTFPQPGNGQGCKEGNKNIYKKYIRNICEF